MQQEEIIIGDVRVPVINDGGVIYYPISFIMEKVLLKKTSQGGLQKEYSNYIKKLKIDYGFKTGGMQNVNCVSEEGLRLVLGNSKIERLDVDQRKAMNILLEYFNMDTISEDERFLKNVTEEMIHKWKYNEYIRDCIKYVISEDNNILWQKCSKCNNYYPYHINFFKENPHSGKDYPLYTVCRDCSCTNQRGKDDIKHPDNNLRLVYIESGVDIYRLHRDHNILEIYNHWLTTGKKKLPYAIQDKNNKLKIIKYMYEKGEFKEYKDLNNKSIAEVCKFALPPIGVKEMYQYVLGVGISEYKNIINDFEGARKVISEYIDKNNIEINDLYDFNYYSIIRGCSLTGFLDRYCNNDALEFIMKYYNNEYPAYKFKGGFKKYWENKENRIKALRYLIEEDMKIDLEKVPLYITLTALRNNGKETMYNVCKKYYSSLFEWINEVYPERFDPKDFDIHYVRNNFDSIEEAEVHDVLKKKFRYVIYNPNNTDRTIKIDGKVPDWFLFTKNKCYIVEYFGMGIGQKNGSHNSRVDDYKERTKDKIDKYNDLDGYGKIYIFPDDLKDNFSGLMSKLEIVE